MHILRTEGSNHDQLVHVKGNGTMLEEQAAPVDMYRFIRSSTTSKVILNGKPQKGA